MLSTTTTSTPTMNRQRPSSHCVYYINPHISDIVCICCDWMSTCWRLAVNILSAPGYLDEANLTRASLVILACHHVDIVSDAWVPPSTWKWLSLVSLSSFFCLLVTRQEAAMAMALVALFLLEAILPLFFVGFTTLLVWKQVSWQSGVIVMAVVSTIMVGLAQWIRQTVYQSMGHGWHIWARTLVVSFASSSLRRNHVYSSLGSLESSSSREEQSSLVEREWKSVLANVPPERAILDVAVKLWYTRSRTGERECLRTAPDSSGRIRNGFSVCDTHTSLGDY